MRRGRRGRRSAARASTRRGEARPCCVCREEETRPDRRVCREEGTKATAGVESGSRVVTNRQPLRDRRRTVYIPLHPVIPSPKSGGGIPSRGREESRIGRFDRCNRRRCLDRGGGRPRVQRGNDGHHAEEAHEPHHAHGRAAAARAAARAVRRGREAERERDDREVERVPRALARVRDSYFLAVVRRRDPYVTRQY